MEKTNKVLTIEEAQQLHNKILNSGRIAAQALVEFAGDLKQMKDTKLYKALGYNTFALYCEQAIGLKKSQAYNYIYVLENNDREFIHSSGHLGIKKLELLTALHDTDRKNFVKEKHNINGKEKTVDEMSTREFAKEIKEKKELYTDIKEDKEVKSKVNDKENLDKAIKRQQELEQEIKNQQQKIKIIKENILLNSGNILEDASVEFEEIIEDYSYLKYNIFFIKGKTRTLIYKEYCAIWFGDLDITDKRDTIVFYTNEIKTLIKEEKDFILAECLKFKEQALLRHEEIEKQREEKREQEWKKAEQADRETYKEFFNKMLGKKTFFNEDEQKILKKFYNTLLMKYHPDHGGTDEEIRAVYKLKEQWGI
jgi:hypothetical protein